jgi:cytochrome c-type biogenesis protein
MFNNILLIPVLFGLIGFLEPCSLGINIIFLNRVKGLPKAKKILETSIFSLVRAFFLALVGLSSAFIGSRIITIQSSFFMILGAVYILFGVLYIINKYKTIFRSGIDLGKYFQKKESVALGLIFGLIIPACAIPLILALTAKSILLGNLLEGFVSLFAFGLALSMPILIISFFAKSNEIISKVSEKGRHFPWLAGVVLIVVGLLTLLSSSWWAGAAR